MHRYTQEQKQFIIDNNYGKYAKELAEMFNRKFNTTITEKEIKYFRQNHRLNSGLTGQFEKGHITHNKGKKQIEFMSKEAIERTKATRFKKGDIPHNHRPIGSVRKTIDGFWEIKVDEPNKWMLKHRWVWEQSNGKIPKGYVLVFLDGNRDNISLENLKLISRQENLVMNNHKLRYENAEITNVANTLAKFIIQTTQRKKTKNEKRL